MSLNMALVLCGARMGNMEMLAARNADDEWLIPMVQ